MRTKTYKILLPTIYTILILIIITFGVYVYFSTRNSSNHVIITDVTATSESQKGMEDSLRFLDLDLHQKESEVADLKKELAMKTSGHKIYGDFAAGLTNSIMMATGHKSDERADSSSQKFLVLAYLGLRNRSEEHFFPEYRFYTKNDTGYIAQLIFSTKKDKQGQQINTYKYGDFKKVNYLYSLEESANGILIPVKSAHLKISYKILMWIFALFMHLSIIFILVTSIIVVINISKGRVFSELNILRLKWLALVCFIFTGLPYLLNSIFYLIYFKDFYPAVSFTHSFFDSDYKMLLQGLIFGVLYLAFKKGYKLQQENDLTV